MNFVKFVGRFSLLKELGFVFKKLYQNNIHYTTWESNGLDSHVWIVKAGGYLKFDGYDYQMSAAIYAFLINHKFSVPDGDYIYNESSGKIETLNYILQFSPEYRKTHRDIMTKRGTVETLKKMWKYGWVEFK